MEQFDPLISVDGTGGTAGVGGLAEEDIMRLIDDRGNSSLVTHGRQYLLVMGGGDGSGAVVIDEVDMVCGEWTGGARGFLP